MLEQVLVSLALALTGGPLAAPSAGARAVLPILCTVRANLPDREMELAQREAARILANAGVRLDWRRFGRPHSGGAPAPKQTPIEVRFVTCGDPLAPPCRSGVLASAIQDASGGRVRLAVVYVERVHKHARPCLGDRATLLGRVVAHELVHLIAGPGAHDLDGLMRANWEADDLGRVAEGGESLSEAVAARIRARLEQGG